MSKHYIVLQSDGWQWYISKDYHTFEDAMKAKADKEEYDTRHDIIVAEVLLHHKGEMG